MKRMPASLKSVPLKYLSSKYTVTHNSLYSSTLACAQLTESDDESCLHLSQCLNACLLDPQRHHPQSQ